MADNTTLNTGSGGDVLRTDDNAGVKTPVTKIELGADGSFDGFVSSANPMPVSLGAAIPAGTNNIGDVDVLTVVTGTGATNLGKAVDNVAGATDTGVAVLALRDDSLGALTPADGDYVQLRVNSQGALHVTGGGGGTEYTEGDTDATITGGAIMWEDAADTLRAVSTAKPLPIQVSLALPAGTNNIGDIDVLTIAAGDNNIGNVDIVTLPSGNLGMQLMAASLSVVPASNITDATYIGDIKFGEALPAGTNNIGDVDVLSVIPGTGATNLGKAIDSAVGATDTGVAFLAIRDDALSALTPVESDYVPLRTDANGALWTIHSGAIAASQSGTWNIGTVTTVTAVTSITNALPAGTNNIGDVDVLTVPAPLSTTGGGTEATALRVTVANDSTGVVSVDDNGASLTVDAVRTTSTISAALATDAIMNNTTALTPSFAAFSSASTGNQQLVAANATKKIRILALQLMATASTNSIYINDGTANLYGDATRKIPLDVTGATGPGGFSLPFNPVGWFETAATNRPININLGSANGVIGIAVYVEV